MGGPFSFLRQDVRVLELLAYVVAGALLALGLLRLRPRTVTTGAALVLLLLAALRSLAEVAAVAASPTEVGSGPLVLLLLAAGLAAGTGLLLLARRSPGLREPLGVAGAALSALALLAPLGGLAAPGPTVDYHLTDSPGPLVGVLAGVLTAGALPALTRRLPASAALLAGLALATLAGRLLDGRLTTAVAAAVAVVLLGGLALEAAGVAVREHGPALGQGALAGVVLVAAAAVAQGADDSRTVVYLGSYVPAKDPGYSSTLEITYRPAPRLVPSPGLDRFGP